MYTQNSTKYAIIVILILMFSAFASANTCYQESANQTGLDNCPLWSLQYDGTYTYREGLSNTTYVNDGDFDTYDDINDVTTDFSLYVNYTIPKANRPIRANYTFKGDSKSYNDTTIPSSCLSEDVLQIGIKSFKSYIYCYNGDPDWTQIGSGISTNQLKFYEESISWEDDSDNFNREYDGTIGNGWAESNGFFNITNNQLISFNSPDSLEKYIDVENWGGVCFQYIQGSDMGITSALSDGTDRGIGIYLGSLNDNYGDPCTDYYSAEQCAVTSGDYVCLTNSNEIYVGKNYQGMTNRYNITTSTTDPNFQTISDNGGSDLIIDNYCAGTMEECVPAFEPNISDCRILQEDGEYTLTADINVTPNGADSCLILNASAVSIDCDGHTIEGAYAFLSNAIIDDGALIQRINKPINELEIQDCIINNGKSSGLTYIDGDFSNGYPNASNIYIHNITTRNGISNEMSMYLGAQLLNNVLIQDIKHEGAGFIYLYATHDGSNFTIKDIQFNYPKQDFIIDIECGAFNGGEKCNDVTIESIKMPTVNTSTFYPFFVYNMNNVIFKNNYIAENLDPSSVGGITEFSNIEDLYLENNTIETSGTWEFYNTMINTSSRINKGYFPNETINISEPTNNIKYYDGCYPSGTNKFYYNNNGAETCPPIPCTNFTEEMLTITNPTFPNDTMYPEINITTNYTYVEILINTTTQNCYNNYTLEIQLDAEYLYSLTYDGMNETTFPYNYTGLSNGQHVLGANLYFGQSLEYGIGTDTRYYSNPKINVNYTTPCTPDWTCDTFAICNSSNILPCTGVADLNTCGETFNGTLSDYDDTCTYTTPTGMFVESDLAPSIIDNFTKILVGLASVAILIGMAGAVAIGARTFRGMKK